MDSLGVVASLNHVDQDMIFFGLVGVGRLVHGVLLLRFTSCRNFLVVFGVIDRLYLLTRLVRFVLIVQDEYFLRQ